MIADAEELNLQGPCIKAAHSEDTKKKKKPIKMVGVMRLELYRRIQS